MIGNRWSPNIEKIGRAGAREAFAERNTAQYHCKHVEPPLLVSKRENYRQMLVGVRMSLARDHEYIGAPVIK
jgi:hypothetical protein